MTIIVGTDGTHSGTTAVDWAAAEAQRRNTGLRIVHAYDWDWYESRLDIGSEYMDVTRVLAEAVVAAAADRARQTAPGIDVETDILIGRAGPQLFKAAHGAELLVLGAHGRRGVAGLFLGSVSRRLVTHSPCPIVVVPGPGAADGPVAAGVDDSPAADDVLRTAFETADRWGCPLVVFRASGPAVPAWLFGLLPVLRPAADDVGENARLEEQVRPWRARYPRVRVEAVLTRDSAAGALTAASHWGRAVVLGCPHGSAGLQLMHQLECPVVVAHAG
ncbi:universal stress protein [Paractinoplanes rishiriensis]|uniref:UspA domain-containing protein n=1 Tax=Paractinoplanes rishiriensis TaxID=1050105 RepID=A0A919K6D8_9ACTN|nr:universal stress protein [Actinoplanes rishiriensis]GIF01761.1 hypothetical protein Ari01nite_92250 [Actinoplanes rishiriensis]